MNARDEAISSSIDASIDNADPEWKAIYLILCRTLLLNQKYVAGGEFKEYCLKRGLWVPDTHNRWVGMPALMQRMGWIEDIGKVVPKTVHSHIGQLTFWRSLLFDDKVLYAGLPSSSHGGK